MEIKRQTFLYPEINDVHLTKYTFGSQNAGDILRADGDWRGFVPPLESQAKNGVDPADCYIEAQLHALATLLEEEFDLKDQVFAPRFNYLLSGGTEHGGDPLKGADSIRNDGVIVDAMMPFDSTITSQQDFASWKGANENLCRVAGRLFKSRWEPSNYIVFKREDSLETKYSQLRDALKRSPCPVSVYGVIDNNLQYISKPRGVSDTHLVLSLYLDPDNSMTVLDTYPPYIKVLPPNYNSDFSMKYKVAKKSQDQSIIGKIRSWLHF